jgi:hypothetical protein
VPNPDRGPAPLDQPINAQSGLLTADSIIAEFALASGATTWIADFDPLALLSHPAFPKDTTTSSFDDRFSVGSASD